MVDVIDTDAMFAAAPDAVQGGEDVAMTLPTVATALVQSLTNASRIQRAGLSLARELTRVTLGRSQVEAPKGDWRWADPTWRENPAYRRMMQSYLAWSEAMVGLAEDSGPDWRAEERARFALNVLTSAAAPTNFLATNPAAVKRAFESGGKSLLRGGRNMLHDWRSNGGMPTQVDGSGFRTGENVAVTPGAVVFRDERCEVIQYRPTTTQVSSRPLVVVPPQINKYYFLDLAPGRSFVEYAVSRGLQTFIISWRNPGRDEAHWGLDEYATSLLAAIDTARAVSGSDDVNLLGFCAGGILSSTVLNHLAATGDQRVNTASFAVTLLDFEVPAMIGLLASPGLLGFAKWSSRRSGVLAGASLGKVFTWFRPNDLVWNYWVNNYLLGEDPPVFDILAWNADATNLPAALHGQFLDIFGSNLLCKPDSLTVLGSPVDLSRIEIETYVTGALTDHLTPWTGCYRTTQLMSGPSTFVLSHAGHIQALVNPPGNPKAFYHVGGEPGPDPEKWREGAERRPGSWWEHWAEWVLPRSGEEHPAPSDLGNQEYPPLAPAPGDYVRRPA
jgi:poly[(R)-3-hydroxyalkanoate] polymerase subunit PhaC